MSDWKADLPRRRHPGARRAPRARGRRRVDVAVFRNAEDKVFALLDRCPHKGGPLSRASCSATAWPARCTTGPSAWPTAARSAPDEGCTPRFACRSTTARCCSTPTSWRRRHDLRASAGPSPRRCGDASSTCSAACASDDRDPLHLPLLRRRLRRDHRERRRADHRRARRPRPPGQLRPAVHQGQHAAPDRQRRTSRGRRGCCSRMQRAAARRGARSRSAGTTRSTSPPTASRSIDRASTAPTRSASTSPASC